MFQNTCWSLLQSTKDSYWVYESITQTAKLNQFVRDGLSLEGDKKEN